jgi:molybdopterin-guanine dinucleotide biosynthesis protein B
LRVAVLKHAHHHFDIDQPGKDSFRHRAAGAGEVLLASSARWVLMSELRGAPEPTLEEYVAHLSPCDLVLVEGFKDEAIPKLEVYRPGNGKPPLWPQQQHIVAVASDALAIADTAGASGAAGPERSGSDRPLHPRHSSTGRKNACCPLMRH